MPDLTAITSILTCVKTATDLAKLLKDSNVSLQEAESKMQLAELIGLLADAKIELAEIQELILEKDRRIREMEEAQKLKRNMIWRDPVYYQKTENGEEGPFCQQCYDNDEKVIRLQTYRVDHWHCKTCDNTFLGKRYNNLESSNYCDTSGLWNA